MGGIITTIKANKPASSMLRGDSGLATDSSARYLFGAEDGELDIFQVSRVKQMYPTSGEQELNPYTADGMSWEVSINDERIAFWSPMVSLLFSGVRQRTRQATGGNWAFGELHQIAVDAGEKYIFLLTEPRQVMSNPRFQSATFIIDAPEVLRCIARSLAMHLNAYIGTRWDGTGDEFEETRVSLDAIAWFDFAQPEQYLEFSLIKLTGGGFIVRRD